MLHEIFSLDRPIISIDFETTGIYHSTDRIIQIGVCKLYPNGDYKEWSTYVNPTVPIPKEAMEAHHITDEMVKDAPTFKEIHLKFAKAVENCDMLGYNAAAFDVKILIAEFARCAVQWEPPRIVDGYRLWSRFFPRNLTAFIEEFALKDTEGKLIPELVEEFKKFTAHDALHDARWTMRAVNGFFLRCKEAPRSVQAVHDMFFVLPRDAGSLDPDGKIIWKNGEATLNFGKKHNGKSLKQIRTIDAGYLEWMLTGDFSTPVKTIIRDALNGRFPAKT